MFGPGPIGLLQCQVVKAQGAFVILAGITKDEKRLELAKSLGVDVVVDVEKEDLAEVVMKHTDGYGVDKLFECSGAVQALNQGLPLVKKKGTFVQVGIFANKTNPLDQESIIQREITYVGTRSQKPSSWPIALNLLAEGKVDADKMITKIVPLDQWREGFDAVRSGDQIKVILQS